jgi:hypothetical protein
MCVGGCMCVCGVFVYVCVWVGVGVCVYVGGRCVYVCVRACVGGWCVCVCVCVCYITWFCTAAILNLFGLLITILRSPSPVSVCIFYVLNKFHIHSSNRCFCYHHENKCTLWSSTVLKIYILQKKISYLRCLHSNTHYNAQIQVRRPREDTVRVLSALQVPSAYDNCLF